LFDESFFPAYFEDTDYRRRCNRVNVPVVSLQIPMSHDNSSTLNSDPHFVHRNSNTFSNNREHHSNKVANEDFSAGEWSVHRRRLNGWERDR
jgi:GT2 family glycosyltransferase